jgi:beta-xylosidase
VYFKIRADFKLWQDKAYFLYSLDGKTWRDIGPSLQMRFRLEHFVGNRFALFYYATKTAGGHVDFDYFRWGGK